MSEERKIHGHVIGVCRLCMTPNTFFVGETMEEVRTYLADVPKLFEETVDALSPEELAESGTFFTEPKISRFNEDVYRVQTSTRKNAHDIIAFTTECDLVFEECRAVHAMEILRISLQKKVQEMLSQSGIDPNDPTTFPQDMYGGPRNEPTNNNSEEINNRASDILKSLDLPPDFMN